MEGMPGPLIDARWRLAATVSIASGVALALALAILFFHGRGSGFDSWVLTELDDHLGRTGALALLGVTDPWMSMGLLAGVVVVAALVLRWDVAVFALTAPLLAVGATEWVLKPLIGRTLGPQVLSAAATVQGCFPSGHETGVASTALVLLVVSGQVPLHRPARIGLAGLLGVWVVLAAVGLVRNHFHYATDTVGALGVSVAVVLSTALLVDRLGLVRPTRVMATAGPPAR
jgi:membrane-associated phospholipid phosphatase